MSKLKKLKSNLKYIFFIAALTICTTLPVFAADETGVITADQLQPVVDALSAQFNVSMALAVISLTITACVGLAFMWWGVRKVTRALTAAFKSGRIKLG